MADEKGEHPDIKITRRKSLALLVSAAATAPLAAGEVKKLLIQVAASTFSSTSIPEQTNKALSKVLDLAPGEENEKYKELRILVSNAVETYQQESGKKAFYSRDPSYKPIGYYETVFNELQLVPLQELSSNRFTDLVVYSFNERQRWAYQSSFNFFNSLQDAAIPGSGFYERLSKKFGSALDSNLTKVSDVDTYEEIEDFLYRELSSAQEHIELLASEAGHPVSSSKVFEYMLHRNEGDIAKALFDTSIFLKFMTRNDIDSRGEYSSVREVKSKNLDWMQTNIRDEFKGPDYTNLKATDSSAVNLIGKSYHSWTLVALLQFFPDKLIHAGCYYELYKHLEDHGVGKVQADLSTLSELADINKFLEGFIKAD